MSLFDHETNWFTIASGRPFLDDLARRLYRELGPDGSDELADAVILLPNRRGARNLAESFVRAAGGRALLLPQVRALGDLDEGEPPFEPGDIALDLAPAISPWRRRFELARLVHDHFDGDLDTAAMLQFADALGGFFDSLEIEEVKDRERIADLVDADMADHWRKSARFLALAVEAWPQRLEALGLTDSSTRRIALLRRLADKWTTNPPPFPVIAAGSTGSVKASAAVLAAIGRAPRGCVVLPGLDVSLAGGAWAKIDPQHPQFALKGLLELAGLGRDDVAPWSPEDGGPSRWRRRVLNEALRPAEATGDWVGQIGELEKEAAGEGIEPIRAGLEGLQTVTARAEDEAAAVTALLLRETLQDEGRTAALITPDQAFARRVSARLARWGVAADTSAGSPLTDCPAGVMVALIAAYFADPQNPVTLLALLKHPFTRLGLEGGDLAAERDILERYALRGTRPRGWDATLKRLSEAGQHLGFTRDLAAAMAPAENLFESGQGDAGRAARVLAETAEALARGPDGATGALWAGQAGERAADLLSGLIADGGALPPLSAQGFARLIEHLLGGESVRAVAAFHPRLQILGTLEARLVQADRVILAGLEEGTWPPNAPTDPFLSRPMRTTLGLPSPERRIGLSAHDFVQLAAGPEVFLVHTQRKAGQPTVKSRWLWRLETLARGAGETALAERRDLFAWAAALDDGGLPSPASRPAPCPPVEHRPRQLSVTRVEALTRDPYSIWAQKILRLNALDRPDKEADAMMRGSAIHKAFETFVEYWPGDLPENAAEEFCRLYLQNLREAGIPAPAMAREEALAKEAAVWIAEWEAERRRFSPTILAERSGELRMAAPGGEFTLTATADRLEILPDGTGHVLDFKTGAPPSAKQVATGFSPQLTLTAAILLNGGFDKAQVDRIGQFIYVQVTGRKPAGKAIDPLEKEDTPDQVAAALAGLKHLIAAYDQPDQPYRSRTAPQFVKTYASDYDHLARVYEWATAADEGGGE